ncbi:MAG: hypothetical protein MUE42_07825 [Opitutaceae bacterium]|jgi:hypothetical protein|nr:hypothetical protein [Opitutaceae bacterium]
MRLASPQFLFWVLLPAAVLVLAGWWHAADLARREEALDRQARELRAELGKGGYTYSADTIRARLKSLEAETEMLRVVREEAASLARDALVRDLGERPFQLIEFERERATLSADAQAAAERAKVKLDASAFEVLADNTESPSQPRRRWAQLALAREAAARAIAAKVTTYEALPVPAVREVRTSVDGPVIADQILFSVRVTGASARVQEFVEYVALGVAPSDLRFVIEHFVLRKDGTTAPDQAAATVVFAGLLPPLNPSSAP